MTIVSSPSSLSLRSPSSLDSPSLSDDETTALEDNFEDVLEAGVAAFFPFEVALTALWPRFGFSSSLSEQNDDSSPDEPSSSSSSLSKSSDEPSSSDSSSSSLLDCLYFDLMGFAGEMTGALVEEGFDGVVVEDGAFLIITSSSSESVSTTGRVCLVADCGGEVIGAGDAVGLG